MRWLRSNMGIIDKTGEKDKIEFAPGMNLFMLQPCYSGMGKWLDYHEFEVVKVFKKSIRLKKINDLESSHIGWIKSWGIDRIQETCFTTKKEAVDFNLISSVSQLNDKQKRMLMWIEQNGKNGRVCPGFRRVLQYFSAYLLLGKNE